MEKMSKEQFCAVYGGGSEDCFPHRQEQDRQAAVEALQDAISSIGINATGTGCSQWTAQNFFAYLEARGFTIVRKEK